MLGCDGVSRLAAESALGSWWSLDAGRVVELVFSFTAEEAGTVEEAFDMESGDDGAGAALPLRGDDGPMAWVLMMRPAPACKMFGDIELGSRTSGDGRDEVGLRLWNGRMAEVGWVGWNICDVCSRSIWADAAASMPENGFTGAGVLGSQLGATPSGGGWSPQPGPSS